MVIFCHFCPTVSWNLNRLIDLLSMNQNVYAGWKLKSSGVTNKLQHVLSIHPHPD